jgi:hypothetical protein
VPTDMMMSFDTDVLDPVVVNDNFCRFVIPNKGFLHSFSKITLQLNTNGLNDLAIFPINVGVHSLIDRCALKIGTTTIAEVADFGHYMAYKSLFIDNQVNREREAYLTGRQLAFDWVYWNSSGAQSDVNASFYQISTRRNPIIAKGGDGDNSDFQPDPVLQNENAPIFSVSVADLFEFLKFNQLPLYMIDQQVSIELHFKAASSLGRMVPERNEGSGGIFTINTANVKFVSDHIYYDGDIMENYRSQNPEMNWTYVDYQLNKRSFTDTQLQSKQVFNVGGAGRLVNKVFSSLEHIFAASDLRLTNQYCSVAPILQLANNGVVTTNLRYNDNYLFPIDRTNPALHFHALLDAEQNVPHVTREMYSNERGAGGLDEESTFLQYQSSSETQGLAARFMWLGYRLNRNERVSSRGIELEVQYQDLAVGNYTHRTYLELVKSATLRNGVFSTDFA